jgi:hypothetical protein
MVFQAIEETNFTETEGKYFFVHHEDMHEAAITFVDTTLPGLIKQGTEYPEVRKLENFQGSKRRTHGTLQRVRRSLSLLSNAGERERARITIALPAAANMEIMQSFLIQLRNFPPLKQKENAPTPTRNHWFPTAKEADNVSEVSGTTEATTKQERQASQ